MVDEPKRVCLFICQLDDQGSPPSAIGEVVQETLVGPAIEQFADFEIRRLDHDHETGTITEAMVEDVESADVVIADVSYLSSSGYFEIGMRRAADLPLVLIADTDHVVPFHFEDFGILRYSTERAGPAEDEIRALVDLIKQELDEPRTKQTQGLPRVKRPPAEQRVILAQRIEDAADALEALRLNSIDTVEELKSIATELRQTSDDQLAVALRKAATSALKAIAAVFDQMSTQKGARIVLTGIIASVLGAIGSPAVVAFGVAMAPWYDKATFLRALEIVFRRGGDLGKVEKKSGERKK